MKHNYLGLAISGHKEFQDPSFGYYDEDGCEHVFWTPENDIVDCDGFDKRNIEPNDYYCMDIVLPYGKIICRYGNKRGRLTTDLDSNYDDLGLPYVKESVEYHEYKVVADGLRVKCMVLRGRVAPMFYSKGGAVQYKHEQSIAQEMFQGKLEEVFIYDNSK